MLKSFFVDDASHGVRLDRFISDQCNISRSKSVELILRRFVKVNETFITKQGYRVKQTQSITVEFEDPTGSNIKAEDIPIEILYEDSDMIVVNKPKGMLTHPTPREESGTLVNALLYHSKDLAMQYGIERAGIVHRLDRATSGIIVTAKNNKTHAWISSQFQERKVTKKYIAVVYGKMLKDKMDIIVPLHIDHKLRKVVPSPNGKFAATRIKRINGNDLFTVLKVQIYTGRTHQIRVHMQYIGHPVVGDLLYGVNAPNIPSYKTAAFIPSKSQLSNSSNEKDVVFKKKEMNLHKENISIIASNNQPITALYSKKPIKSDVDYSQPVPLLLHSYSLKFVGSTGRVFEFTCPPPNCFDEFLNSHGIETIFK
ncbi:MAG: RluA family pseudouridine synthase [Caldisericia bacterium]|nr:RluA family pseudouridine synthase [Caldisericia bacterium]